MLLASTVTSCGPARQGYETATKEADEQSLKTELSSIREVIREYTADKRKPPQALRDLVDAGYINQIPTDPMTDKADCVIVPYNCPPSAKCKEGIKDIHSASTARSNKGDLYSEW
jgi:general secretion pathway protein G